MPEKVVVGTRGSKLALAQTKKVVELLKKEYDYEIEVKVIKTSGDVLRNKPLHEFKGAGAFVQTIDLALVKGTIDVAVHSYKDVPSKISGVIAAVLRRESPCDCAILRERKSLFELPENAVVGTSSLRRRAQIKRFLPKVRVENLRGNVDTRLKKLKDFDAIILAEAGLIRLGIDVDREVLDPEKFVPSANQGIIAVETRKGEEYLVSSISDEDTFLEASVERAVLETLNIGCAIPAGIFAKKTERGVKLITHIYHVYPEKDIRFEATVKSEEEAKEIAKNYREECCRIIKEVVSRE